MNDTPDTSPEAVERLARHTEDASDDEYPYCQPIGATLRALSAERDALRKLDSEAATHVESVIVMRTGFTGDPPYVGWKGLGLALTEALDERDALKAERHQKDARA